MQDLAKETAPYYKKAKKFFDALAGQLARQGHALDVFACSLDQVWNGRHSPAPWLSAPHINLQLMC